MTFQCMNSDMDAGTERRTIQRILILFCNYLFPQMKAMLLALIELDLSYGTYKFVTQVQLVKDAHL